MAKDRWTMTPSYKKNQMSKTSYWRHPQSVCMFTTGIGQIERKLRIKPECFLYVSIHNSTGFCVNPCRQLC